MRCRARSGTSRKSLRPASTCSVRERDPDNRIATRAQLALDLQLRSTVDPALLLRHLAPARATGAATLTSAPVEDDLHRVVTAERPPQRLVEIRPLAPDDEQEPPDRLGHALHQARPDRRK